MGRGQLLDLFPDLLERLEPQVGAEASIQSGRAVPGGVTFWPRVLTRPSMLVVEPATSA
jgi:hypothetical protein